MPTVMDTELDTSWMIPFSQLNFQEEVGRGSFGVVYRGTYLGTQVAIKQLIWNEKEASFSELRKEFETEVRIMQTLRHPNILMFMGLCQNEKNQLFIVTEFLEGGSLEERLEKDQLTSWTTRVRICLEVARALGLMHERNYIHRDLKWDNILLDGHWHVKVSDFGLSRIVKYDNEEDRPHHEKLSAKGEIWWRAPEVDRGDYDQKVDIFSFGMLVATIITTSVPNSVSISDLAQRIREHIFANMTKKGGEIIYGVDSSKLRELWPPDVPPELAELAVKCCEYNPQLRPSSKQVVNILQELYGRLTEYELYAQQVIKSPAGAQIWLALATGKIETGTSFENIEVSSQKLVEHLENYIFKTTSVQLDFDHKEFLTHMLCHCPADSFSTQNLSSLLKNAWGSVTIDSFADFWRWFEATDVLLRNPKILPLFRVGFIKGFISSEKARRFLRRRNIDGTFVIRFSRSSPGNLSITSFQDGEATDLLVFAEKSGFVPDTDLRKSVYALFFTLQDLLNRELDYLKFVYPAKSVNCEEFTRAHDIISDQVKRDRRIHRKDSGDFSFSARRFLENRQTQQSQLQSQMESSGIPLTPTHR